MESLTRPAHRRKLSNANGVFSFSSKSTYDDVFAAPPPATAAAAATAAKKFKAKVGVEEYGEIFGGGSRSSSIPVLDLSALDDERRTGSEDHRSCSKKLDYAKIFGGFRDEDIAVPYEELLAAKGKKCSSDKAAMNQSVNESLLREPDSCSLSGNINGHSSEVSDQSLDGVKQVNMSYHKSSPRSKDGASGTTHIAKLHAVPGFTYFIDETARQQKTEGDRPVPVPSRRSDVQRTWSFSGNIHEENNGRKTEKPMANTLTSEGVIKGKRGSWRDGSRSNDKLFNSGEIDLKSQSFKSSPSSSPPAKRDDSKGHPKQSKSSNFASKANAFEKPGDYLTSSSDEELDMNSAAAASAAALKKAIEQAQESIRLAKELMERKKDGFQGYSKPSSKGKSRKGSRVEREANNIKENNAKETCERLNDVLQEFTGRNKKATLRTDEIATASEHSEKHSASRKVEMEKHQKNVVKIHGETTWISDLGNNGNHRTTASASRQIENKNTMKDKQVCDFGEMKTSEETSESIETSIEKTKANEQDVGLGNAENRTDVQQKAPESKETVNKSDSARMLHEYGVRNDLKITQEDILTEDIRKRFDEWEEFGKIFQEHLDVIKEEKLEHPRLEDDFMRKESQKLLEEKEPHETLQREHIEKEPEDAHVKEEENENTIGNNCNEVGGMVQEEACLFVEKDHKPIGVLGSRSYEKAHEDIQEGEDSERLGLIQGRDIDQMVVIHAHNGLETRRISEEKLKEEKVKELDLKEMELMDAHDGEKRKNILMEEHGGEEVQRRQDETYTNVEANQKIPEEDSEWEVVGKRTKEAYVNEATESLWIEADKSSENQKAEVMQETEEAESVHLKGDNFDNNQEIDFLQKADYAGNSETALGTFSKDAVREFQEASRFEVSNESVKRSQGTVENHEDSRSTRVMNESFDQCERDADEAGAKEASELEEREISEAGPFVQSARQEHVIPSDMQSDSKAVDSDGNAANVHCNEINHAQKLSNENVFETADLVQNGVKENEINIKMEAFEAHHCDEKAAYTGSFENSRQTETEENVEEKLSFDPKIGGGLVQESGENSENIEEADVAFDKEEKRDDVKMVNKQRTMEEDSKEVRSIALASHSTTNQVSMETHKELKTVQNMQHSEEYLGKAGAVEGKEIRETKQKGLKEKDDSRKTEANKRERGWNTDRIAVERAIREARERAFAEARERAERAAVERAAAEVRQRAMTEAREKLEKATGGSKLADKASIEAKVRAERAAVERATAEARERALEKALSQKSTAEARAQEEKLSASRDNGLKHSFSSSDLESLDGTNNESAQRRKARLERHQRIMERAEKALAEKNMRDLQAQKEQAERNRLAESLDADIKRWASGKEGNLRALISTLQYILGPNSGWQPISLTEIITTAAVKKAYRKATLYVHPDKLQQRGASIQQKYICEKVFDLLKAAWNRFNSEER